MKQKKQFTELAEYYDKLNGADFSGYADKLCEVMNGYGIPNSSLVLELGCGTGSLTLELASRGYDMIGADISCEMLNIAMRRAAESGANILYLLQDMRSFELYGTVGAVICANDGMNYLTSEADVLKCMKLVRNYLDPDGLFIFDVNTPWRFREVFAKRDFFFDDGSGEVYMGWRSQFDDESGECDFWLTLFTRNEDGSYTKREEQQREKLWTMSELTKCIEVSGLELLGVYSSLGGAVASENSGEEKWYFVCRAKK